MLHSQTITCTRGQAIQIIYMEDQSILLVYISHSLSSTTNKNICQVWHGAYLTNSHTLYAYHIIWILSNFLIMSHSPFIPCICTYRKWNRTNLQSVAPIPNVIRKHHHLHKPTHENFGSMSEWSESFENGFSLVAMHETYYLIWTKKADD